VEEVEVETVLATGEEALLLPETLAKEEDHLGGVARLELRNRAGFLRDLRIEPDGARRSPGRLQRGQGHGDDRLLRLDSLRRTSGSPADFDRDPPPLPLDPLDDAGKAKRYLLGGLREQPFRQTVVPTNNPELVVLAGLGRPLAGGRERSLARLLQRSGVVTLDEGPEVSAQV